MVLLAAWRNNDLNARDKLFSLLYKDLANIASRLLKREQAHISIFTGDLVSEAVVRLLQAANLDVVDRTHLLALSARVMRHVLLDRGRHNKRFKRKGMELNIPYSNHDQDGINFNLITLEHALIRLHAIDPERADIVEMRYFGGMTVEEIATVQKISPATVKRSWTATRKWLQEVIKNDLS
tara:strand:+ start:244 stop:786 length:543 start_codon:yes stop_codon:yes gene_type:complete